MPPFEQTPIACLQSDDTHALPTSSVPTLLAQLIEPVTSTETVGVFAALGRVLAHDVVSPVSVPPHDNAAMDGFAFDGGALRCGHPLRLQIANGTAFAGAAWSGQIDSDCCVKIMTGAIMPAGLDTVVPLELVKIDGSHITIPPNVLRRGDNRRLLGEDLMAGQAALRHGQILGPAALGLIASLGLPQVDVFRRLKVAYFSTGDEILSLGEPPREGAVYDSNRYTIYGLLTRMGVEVVDMGVIKDEPAAIEVAVRKAAQEADAIITSGGMGIGEADHIKRIMQQLGEVAFWRIAMRPGRPMAVGRINTQAKSAVLFGLPGNPVAAMVTYLVFVRTALLLMMGSSASEPLLLQARSAEVLRKKPGRTEYQRGIVTREADGRLQVRPTGNQGSGVLRSMVEANGLILLHHNQGGVEVGDTVDVMMFDGVI